MNEIINPYKDIPFDIFIDVEGGNRSFHDFIIENKYSIALKENSELIRDWKIMLPNPLAKHFEFWIVCPVGSVDKSIFTHELLRAYLFAKGFQPFCSVSLIENFNKRNPEFKQCFLNNKDAYFNSLQHRR